MKTLIAYGTKYGCTRKCAQLIAQQIVGEVDVIDLKAQKSLTLNPYQNVIIGGSIYMGKVQKEVREFCDAYATELITKKLALFITCMQDGEVADQELNQAFPEKLVAHAVAKVPCGGEMIFEKMKFMDRFIAKKVAKSDENVYNLNEINIKALAQTINNASL